MSLFVSTHGSKQVKMVVMISCDMISKIVSEIVTQMHLKATVSMFCGLSQNY